MNHRLSVIIPAYNETSYIDTILERVLKQKEVFEVIVVDDGSTDTTWNMLKKWPSKDPRVKIFQLSKNQGKGAAVHEGIIHVSGSAVLIQDADLEYNPADYPTLLAKLSPQNPVVYGSRFLNKDSHDGTSPWWHKFGNTLFTLTANFLSGQNLTDVSTCYKLFDKNVLDRIKLREKGFEFCPEITMKVSGLGIHILEVPISYRARTKPEGKKIRYWSIFSMVLALVKYRVEK